MEKTDSELVDLARAGDKDAFGVLIERHQGRALRVARGVVSNGAAAEELVQEAMLQAYLSLDRLRETARFGSWLHGIVLNVCRGYLRERERAGVSWEALEWEPDSTLPALPGPEELAVQRERERLVFAAVEELSPANREATVLFYYDALSLEQVATALGISAGAVKGRLHQARKQLRERLRPLYPEAAAAATGGVRRGPMIKVNLVHDAYWGDRLKWEDKEFTEQHARHFMFEIIKSQGPGMGECVGMIEDGGDRLVLLPVGRTAGVIRTLARQAVTEGDNVPALLGGLLQQAGVRLEEVRIEPLKEEILHATLRMRQRGKVREISGRLGDAIFLAVQAGCPIFVAPEVMERGSWDLSGAPALMERLRQVGDAASLRGAAEEPFIARVAQGMLEQGTRSVHKVEGHPVATVTMEPRQWESWRHIWMLHHYGGGSVGGGNVAMPLELLPVIVARFKAMAGLDVAEQRVSQTGHTSISYNGREYGVGVSTEPTEMGEKLALRLEWKVLSGLPLEAVVVVGV